MSQQNLIRFNNTRNKNIKKEIQRMEGNEGVPDRTRAHGGWQLKWETNLHIMQI